MVKSNLSYTMNKGGLNVYIFIFSRLYGIRKNWRIKRIDNLTTKVNLKRYRYYHPKEFS